MEQEYLNQKMKDANNQFQRRLSPLKTQFHDITNEEREDQEIKRQEKLQAPHLYYQKMQNYSHLVKDHYPPTVSEAKKEELVSLIL